MSERDDLSDPSTGTEKTEGTEDATKIPRHWNWNGLRLGHFQFNDDYNKRGEFVYVPVNYDFSTFGGMKDILNALGIKIPDLVFSFPKSRGIVPPDPAIECKKWKSMFIQHYRTERRKSEKKMSKSSINANKSPKKIDTDENENERQDDDNLVSETAKPTEEKGAQEREEVNVFTTFNSFTGQLKVTRASAIIPSPIDTNFGTPQTKQVEQSYDWQDERNDDGVFAENLGEDIREHIRYVEGNILNLLTAMAEFKNTVFLITDPVRANRFAELACETATESRGSTKTIGLFHVDIEHSCGGLTADDTEQNVYYEDIEKKSVALGEVPKEFISIMCKRDYGSLANVCSSRLVFATKDQKEEFARSFQDFFPMGFFACGATQDEMEIAMKALKNGWPLFGIGGTGAVATITKEFVHVDKWKKSKRKGAQTWQRALIETVRNIKPLFYTEGALHEAIALLKADSGMFRNYNPRSYYHIPITEGDINTQLNKAMIAEGNDGMYGDEGNEHDYALSKIQMVKDNITRVMATVFDSDNEIGGDNKDEKAIDECNKLIHQIKLAKIRYMAEAVLIQIAIRVFVLATTISTTLAAACFGTFGKDDFYANDNITKDGICTHKRLDLIYYFGLILPITAAALQAIDKTLRPYSKYANLLLTQHQLCSEVYFFRARIAVYSPFDRTRGLNNHDARSTRCRFTDKCASIYGECMKQDFKEGSLKLIWISGVFPYILTTVHVIGSWFASTLRKFGICLFCNPMKKRPMCKDEVGDDDFAAAMIPENWFVKLFTTKQGYGRWQAKHLRKTLRDHKNDSRIIDSSRKYLSLSKDEESQFQIIVDDRKCYHHHQMLERNQTRCQKISLAEYARIRLIPAQEEFENRLPLFIFFRNSCQFSIIGFTALSSFLVAKDLEKWVAIALAAAAAADAILSFFQYEGLSPALHTAESELKKVLLDFKGLGILERRLPSNKRVLIERSEDAILSYYKFKAESALKVGRKDSDEEEQKLNLKYKEIALELKEKRD